jgi:diadenosine tetraphosphatase ApaH/serine/threonine PP2A family protein phosphatase
MGQLRPNGLDSAGYHMKAVLSDVHGNLEALRAVLDDIAHHGVSAVTCLGDLVGYGPNPRECVDLAMAWQLVLLGDHDQAATAGPAESVRLVNRAVLWTRSQLAVSVGDAQATERRLRFLAGRPQTHREGGFLFVHASPRDPLHEEIVPEDISCRAKMERIFALVERCCLTGHTHVSGVFTEGFRYHTTEEVCGCYRLDGRKVLVNVGSVGQPRDDDPRACYVLLDGDAGRFRRVEYDVEATVRKIHAIADLDDVQGDRLREGR